MAGYGRQQQQFYTQQEEQDAYASRLEHNPNRVAGGYVNYGPQIPHQQAPAPNWQATPMGQGSSTPVQVSQIWNSTPPPVQSLGGQSSFGAPFASQQPSGGLGGGAFAAPTQNPKDVSAIFQSLGIDTNAAPPQHAGGGGFPSSTSVPGLGTGFPTGLNPVGAMGVAAVQQPFMNGGLGGVPRVPGLGQQPSLGQQPQLAAGSAQGPSAQTLMSLLQQPSTAPALNTSAFAPLGNGAVPQAACGSRAQAGFSNLGQAPPQCQVPQCQVPQNGLTGAGNAFAPSHAFAPPAARGPPPGVGFPSSTSVPGLGTGFPTGLNPVGGIGSMGMGGMGGPPARPVPPKTLSSVADYSSAAANYKAPPTRTVSISRKPEMQAKSTASMALPLRAADLGPDHPALQSDTAKMLLSAGVPIEEILQQLPPEELAAATAPPPAPEEDGWLTASRAPVKSAAPQNASAGASAGKSKAQNKNEKRRAKKRDT